MSQYHYIDPYVVELLVNGEPVTGAIAPKERRAAALQLSDRGWSAARIAERVGVSTRTVVRVRAERRNSG